MSQTVERLPAVRNLADLRAARDKANQPYTPQRLARAARALAGAETAIDAAAVSVQHYQAFLGSTLSRPAAAAALTASLRESLRAQSRALRAAAEALSEAAG